MAAKLLRDNFPGANELKIAHDRELEARTFVFQYADNAETFALSALTQEVVSPTLLGVDRNIFESRKRDLGYFIKKEEPIVMMISSFDETNPSESRIGYIKQLSDLVGQYEDMIIQQYNVQYQERYSVLQTFSHPFISFYGDTVPMYQFVVSFRNDDYHKEYDRFKAMYDAYLRPPLLVEHKLMLRLVLGGEYFIDGYIISMSASKSGTNPFIVNSTWNFLVVEEKLPFLIEMEPKQGYYATTLDRKVNSFYGPQPASIRT